MKVNGKKADLSDIAKLALDEKQKGILSYMDNLNCGGYLNPQQVAELLQEWNITLPELMNYLIPYATKYSVAPISSFPVGAIAHGISGALYFGANIELLNTSLSFTIHAEQAAIAHAISYNETGVDYLAISATPCGYCRQFLYEITNCPTTPDITILMANKSFTLSSLLPYAFGPKNLGVSTRLMLPQNNNLQIKPEPSDPYILKALQAANISYAPYTLDHSGVCIVTSTSSYTGAYAQCAAYNPSMPPLESALAQLIINGDSFENITRVILVENAQNKIAQKLATTNVLAAISKSLVLEYQQANFR